MTPRSENTPPENKPADKRFQKTAAESPRHTVGRKLAAVEDAAVAEHGEGAHFRLGVVSTQPEAKFTIGESGPNGQRLPWLYLKSGATRYEFAFDDGKLTVASQNPNTGQTQAVVYTINAAAMAGQEIATGETVSVIFAYDEKSFLDNTPAVDEWVATTGPRFGKELEQQLGLSSDVVIKLHDMVEEAKEEGRYGEASRAPRSAEELVDVVDVDPLDANVEIDLGLPEGVQIYDPQTGKTYVGRRWARENEEIAVAQLIAAGYRLAIVRFTNGDMATLMPNFRGRTLGIQIKTHHGIVERVLDGAAMDIPLGPGHNIKANVISTFDGDTSKAGPFASPPIESLTAVGPAMEANEEMPELTIDNSLEEFRAPVPEVEKVLSRKDFDLAG